MDRIMPNPTPMRRTRGFYGKETREFPSEIRTRVYGTVYSTTRINILKFFKSFYFCHFYGAMTAPILPTLLTGDYHGGYFVPAPSLYSQSHIPLSY